MEAVAGCEASGEGSALVEVLVMGAVVEAVERDLRLMGGGLELSTLAASALALARELDASTNSATSKSMVARSLLDTMDRLRELAPPKREMDSVDEVEQRRRKRLADAGLAGTADQPRS